MECGLPWRSCRWHSRCGGFLRVPVARLGPRWSGRWWAGQSGALSAQPVQVGVGDAGGQGLEVLAVEAGCTVGVSVTASACVGPVAGSAPASARADSSDRRNMVIVLVAGRVAGI